MITIDENKISGITLFHILKDLDFSEEPFKILNPEYEKYYEAGIDWLNTNSPQ